MALAAILIFGLLTLWIPGRWALSAFEVAICVFAAVRIFKRRGVGIHPAGLLLAAIAAWTLIQIAAGWSVEILKTQQAALDAIVNLAAFSLALEGAADAEWRDRFVGPFVWFAAVIAALAILTVLTSRPGMVFWRFPVEAQVPTLGPFVYRNQYAAFVEVILPVAVMRAAIDRGRAVTYLTVAALLFGSVIVGGSRTGTFLCLAEILIVPVFAYRERLLPAKAMLRAVAGSVAAIVLAILVVGWQTIWTRLEEPHPYALRANLVRSTVAMVRDRPWTGVGLGAWAVAYPHYALFDDGSFVNQAHNDWLQWAAEGGLPVFAMMLAVFAAALRPAARTLWGLGIVAVFVHCIVDYPFRQRPALAAFFFAWLGLVVGSGDGTRDRRARSDGSGMNRDTRSREA